MSMLRVASISSENPPPPPDIQHIEGQLWYVKGKNGPGRKHASLQWVVCEDQRLSIYSSWANSRRLIEEMCFERVHILFDFLHPHKHPEVLGSGAPQTRRLSIHRNEPRTTAELRYAFQIRDPCDVKTFAGYHYFGVEYVLRDLSTERLRRSLAIFCTDHPDDHRKWRDFWEEMQVRYPMVRNRSATSMPMDMSSELMSEFLLPSQAARRAVEGQSKQDTDSVSSSCLPSPINQDDDNLTGTRTPEWTDSEHRQLHSRGSTPPPPFVLLGSTTTDGVHQNLLGNLRAGDEKVQAESIAQWIALLVDAERQAREGIELIEAATHSLLEANQKLRDLAYHVLPAATFPPSMGLACGKGEGSACDGTSGGVSIRDGDTIHSLQAELKELLVALEEVKSAAAYPTSAPEALASAESVAASNQELLATYERELAELRAQNATLRSELDTHAAIATERVERALDEWTRAGVVDIADGDTEHEGSGRRGTNVVSPASRQRYLTADEALLRALIEAALGRESSTAAFAASSGSSSSAQVSTQDGSASDLQASHSASSTNADEHDGAITAGQSLGTASDSHQPWGALSRDARLSSAMSAAGALTASLPELVQQHLSTFAAEHDRRLGGPDSAPSSSIEGVLYHVVDEVVTAFNHMVNVPETVEGVSNADGSVAAPAREITAVSSWLSVLHRCLLHRVDVVEAVRATGTRDKSLLSAAEFGGSTADAGGAVDSTAAEDGAIQCRPPAAASSDTRRRGSLPPLTDEEISIIGDLRRSVHDLVAWILDLLAERQQYATSVAALDSMTCQHDVFQPLKEVQAELERTTARFEAAAAVESRDNVAYRHRGVTTPDILPLEAAAASSGADGDPEYSEKHTAGSSDTLKVEHRLKARLQHAMSAFDSACAEAVALRRLLTTILYGSEVPLRSADSTDGVVAAATTNAAAACEAFRAAQDAGIDGVDKLRGAAEASVAVRAREEVWANTLTPAVLQACADALVGGPCIQDVVHSLQLILGRCPEIDGSPKWVGGAADVLPLSKESIWSLVQELHQRLAAEQARCNKLLGGVMLISASLASSESELLAAAYSTAMAATANASAMTDEALKSWAAYSNNSNEVTPEEQRCLHEPAETKANPRLSSFPAACGGENALHEAVHTDLIVTLTSAEGARDLRSTALDTACSLLPNLTARIAGTETTLWRLVGDLLLHGAGTGVPSLEVLLALPIVNHTGVPTAVDASEKDGVSLGDHMRVAGNAVEELLSESEEAARGRREWMQQLLRWLKDFPLASASDAAPELASGLQCDASTAHEVYAQLLEELAAAESEFMSRVGAVGALLRKTSCVHTISVPEMSNEAGGADIAMLAAAASADIAEALHVSEAHISVTEASVDPVQRVVQVSATIAHHPHALTRAAVLGSVHACPCARVREALKGAPANSATTASSMNEQSTARPVTVDSPEGMDAVSCLSTSLLHRAAKIAAVVEFEKRVLALLPTAQDTAVANVRMSTIDAMPACKAGQTLAAMLATELDINPPEANFEVAPTVFPSLLQSLASYLQELHDIVLPVLHHRIINPEKASLEKLRTAVDALHDAAIEKMPHVTLEQLSCIDNTTGMPWPEALNTANLRDLHFIIDHLSTTAKQAVSLNFTDDLFHHLRATAESLGVPPDAYAGECSGERVPTAAQLAERAGAVVCARAEEAAGLRSIAESLGVPPDAYAGECSGERVPTAAQLAERAGAVVCARAEEAAGLRSIAESLGVPPDAYAGECSGERVPTAAQLAERAGAVVCARAEEAAGLRSIAESLGVPPDAYAGECSGERVPTAAQLAERAGAVVCARAEEAAGLRSIAESLGVPPDAYAGECSGERVPTAAQLAERAGAVVRARAEEAAGLRSIAESLGVPPDAYAGECSGEMTSTCSNVLGGIDSLVKHCKSADELASRSACELQAAVSVLVKLWEAVEEAGVVTADLRDGWWAVGGLRRWEVGAELICGLSAAVEVSREEVGDASERIKLFEEQLVDVERDQNESREAITAAVEKLRGGLEEVNAEDNGEMSPPSSCGSTVCGPLFASLRQLTSEVSDVASVLRRVKQVLEEHNAEEKCMPELEEMSFPASQGDGSDGLMAGKVVMYEDVVAGVRAKVDALRKERAKRLETDSVLKNFLSAVADQGSFTSEEPVSRPPSLTLRRCMKPKAKPQPADLDSSVTEEFALLRTPLHLPASNDSTATPLGRSCSIPVPLASWATGDMLEKVCHHMNEAENAVRIMRVAVAAAYEALGGENDVVHASDDEAARLLVELARNTAVSIESVRSLLDPLERRDAPTGQRESLAQLMDRIKGKLGSSSGCSMPTVLQVVEEGMQLMHNEANSSRPSPRSSVNRRLPRKQKPVSPEVVGSESFSLTHQVTYSRDNSLSSLASTLRVLPLPPPGLPTSAEDFEKKIGCRMKELDALRRGCSIALRTLDSSLKVSDMDCDTMVMHLVGRCNDVQTAMQITDAVFEDENMISELSSAKTLYSASNRSASEHPLLMRCSTLVSAVKSLSNVCESMRHTQANMAKQQRFLIHNEAQNTSEMRRALLELEEKLRDANAELMESHKVREATEKKAAEVSCALEMAQNQLSNLQNVRNDMEESLTQLKQQHDEDAYELDRAEEKLNTLSNSVSRLQESLEVASDVVREEVLGACQRLHLAVIGREMPEPEIPAEGRSQELLLPALHVITKALQSAMEETTRFATRDKGIATAFAEERVHAAQQAAALRGELASIAEAKEVAEARAKATAKHLKQTEDAFEDEVAKLKRALRNSEAMLEDEEANHQRRLRQAQAAAEDQLAAVQRRLDSVMCVQAEEARLRVASEENVQKLRDALAEAESELARQQRHAAEDVMTQRKEDMRRIESLEADLAAARLHSNELAQALGRATHDGVDAARALEASAQDMAQLAAELADTRAQLRTGNEELASICATIASTGLASSMTSSASLPAPPARATELLEGLLGHIAVLQRALETQEMVQQRRRTRGTQSEDFVAETLAAFTAIWAAAVKAGRAPARLNEEWLTPMDKADVVSNVLTRDDSPRLDDLAATRQRLLGLLCRSPLHYQGGSAALGPLENATTAALLQTYHEAMEGCYGAQQAALERELRDAHSKIQTLLARLQEQEEQHTIEATEVEIRVRHMRAMVQSKLMADEIAEQRMRETEASVHRHFVLES
ncbi:conserved hypothetical protein [Leishmania braziliensis MHOM/BR/75/M2904]|uniref:Uncharacterized protein n=1 Tax=Leishmania braziliensis TaxID=5660 RepID=A4HMG7_LEIBR|nr:conserved hypothetical protein [Leishmania braziliensis MHOM/BR/75/M2904]CAM43354.2 conserved hypothetical protein [Leishmania braziliensis MHOM/BR/75/M2904]